MPFASKPVFLLLLTHPRYVPTVTAFGPVSSSAIKPCSCIPQPCSSGLQAVVQCLVLLILALLLPLGLFAGLHVEADRSLISFKTMLYLGGGLLFTRELQRGSPRICAVSGITPARASARAGRGNAGASRERHGCQEKWLWRDVCVPCHLSPAL